MSILRMISILIMGTLLFVVLQLPDDLHQADAGFSGLADADFRRLSSAEWKAGRKAAAVTLLGYAVENRLPDAAACAGVREGYLAVMESDQTMSGSLALLGLQRGGSDGGFKSLAGETVAEWFVGGHAPPVAGDDEFGLQLAAVRDLSSLFPPADPALRLLAAAHAEGLLRAELRQQLRRALGGVAAEESTAAVVTVQETVMPLLQLARQCRSWAEFGTLLRYAGSVDQVKLLARMASLAPLNSGKLARGLMVAEAGARSDLAPLIMDYLVRRGQAGLDALDHVLRKGPRGLEYLMRHPELTLESLTQEPPTGWWVGPWHDAWQSLRAQSGRAATMVKSMLLLLLVAGIIVCLLPWRMLRSADVPGAGGRRAQLYYWLAVLVGGVAVSLLLMLGRGGAPELGMEVAASGGAAPVTSTRQLVSWLVILVLILVVQGACWEMARRKIREVSDSAVNTAMKLRQLENLEIFFDLPLYAGLAMTIFAFILIATLGAGVSRFLAYSSTFVGILFAVALRLGHLYPLRDKLIRQQEV